MTRDEILRQARLHTTPGRVARDLRIRRWMVLAPHPDDETLGAGALICTLADAGRPARVVYLTDGAASHPGSMNWPPGRLAALRRREARGALRRLCGRAACEPVFLDWPDADPHAAGTAPFERSVRRVTAMLQRDKITALVTTWPGEPHCDHAAAASVARAAARRLPSLTLYWCVVWGWNESDVGTLSTIQALPLWSAPRHAARRRAALAQHRSQLGSVISDSVDGFQLPGAMMRRANTQMLFGPVRP